MLMPMIIGEIKRYLRDNNAIRVSRSVRDLAYRALQVRELLTGRGNGDPTVEEIVARFMEILHHEYAHNVPLKAGVADYLRKLKAEGKHLCVLTGSPHLLTDVCLQRNGIWELFDHVWSVDDFGISKDNPAIHQQVEQLLGCGGADITLYDDNRTACATAARSGWYTVGVQDRQKPEFLQQLKSTVDCYLTGFDVL